MGPDSGTHLRGCSGGAQCLTNAEILLFVLLGSHRFLALRHWRGWGAGGHITGGTTYARLQEAAHTISGHAGRGHRRIVSKPRKFRRIRANAAHPLFVVRSFCPRRPMWTPPPLSASPTWVADTCPRRLRSGMRTTAGAMAVHASGMPLGAIAGEAAVRSTAGGSERLASAIPTSLWLPWL